MKHYFVSLIRFLLLSFSFLLLMVVLYLAIFLVGVPYSQNNLRLVKYSGEYFYKNIGYNVVDFLLSPTRSKNIWVKTLDNKVSLRCIKFNIPILNLSGVCWWSKNELIKNQFKRIFNKTNQDVYGILLKKDNKITYKVQ